ncbi:26041_t:CDS:2 [Gigaspora margarita]|uniref:26041_t:CDS:1 n=1 Tax=Gigaspora margarita TaxID=4874 RepID=A0ABM8VVQ9_GIGMA|nr:26041_t:CDS:2 [Gigaspora margarita]
MLLKNDLTDLTDFTDKVCTGLKLSKIILEFRELEAHRGYRHAMPVNVLFYYVCSRKACPASRGVCVYCNNNKAKETLKVCDIEQFLEIVDELPPDNTVAIHVTSVPVAFSRIIAKKCASLPNNILFTNIQELVRVIEGYFLMKQDSVKDDMRTIIRKVEELNKRFEKSETQGKIEKILNSYSIEQKKQVVAYAKENRRNKAAAAFKLDPTPNELEEFYPRAEKRLYD